jgi:hypothetical protein
VLGERQALLGVQVHRRGHRDVGDRDAVPGQPFRLGQPRVQDAGEAVPVRCLLGDHRLVRLGL